MKVTSCITAAFVLLALGLIAIWPEHRPGPGPARAVAQNTNAADPNVRRSGGSDSATATVKPGGNTSDILDERLSKRITAQFVETPLNDVLSFFSDTADVQIFLNRKALEDEGVTADTPISIALKSVRLDMLLDLVLEQAGSGAITYVERDGILIVSTIGNLEGASEVRVYNCRDLLAMEPPRGEKAARGLPGLPGASAPGPAINGGIGGGIVGGVLPVGVGAGGDGLGGEGPPLTEAERRAAALKHLIQTAVKPDSWAEQGSFGTISEYNGLLVINHNTKTHKQIDNVLKMLREAAGLEQGKAATVNKQ